MALKPTAPGAIWTDEPTAASPGLPAGYAKDGNGDWYPTSVRPFTGAVLDIAGDGKFTLTDVAAGYPAYVQELFLVSVGGHFIAYL